MRLRNFKHEAVSSVDEACSLTTAYKDRAAVIAGGTDLLGGMKDNIYPRYPELLVDIKPIKGLSYIKEDRRGVRIGSLTTLTEVATHPVIIQRFRLLAEAARSVASPQIRNVATVGGNLCQEPRCWYYRNPENTFWCLRKGGAQCDAILGDNRYHSLFGTASLGRPACAAECPANTDIPYYLARIREGEIGDAARSVLAANPLPAMTGRVCPHFCESKCNRGEFDEAVSVRSIERYVGDYVLDNAGSLMKPPVRGSGKKVAVVGSGPAGLSAAYYLRQAGHQVTIFDRMPEAGGMLTYCIPAYRLPKEIVRKQVQALEQMGIAFKQGVTVGGRQLSLEKLRKDFNAVFLATGVWRQRTLGIEHEELLLSGLDLLVDVQRTGHRTTPGKRVLVIGGGSVAVDVAITALRLGAKEVTMACLEARDIMPAFPEDIAQALQEGVRILPSWGPHRIIQRDGKVAGMELKRCTSVFDAEGRFRPTFDPATTMTIKADAVMLAIGTSADLSYAGKSLATERGLIVADEETTATNLSGVYAGGDAVSGAASVIEAIATGRKAAQTINRSFGVSGIAAREERLQLSTRHESSLFPSHRVEAPEVAKAERRIDREDRPTLDLRFVQAEAQRCVNCGCVAVNASDLAPALIALRAVIRTSKRTVPAAEFFAVQTMKTTVLDSDELVLEVHVPAPRPAAVQSYLKYRVRNAIDFPIVSLASVITHDKGIVKDASLVLGAVAPVPWRLDEVEDYLKSKALSEETAEAAAGIAVKGAQALKNNRYKAQVIRALMRKALLAAST